MYVLDVILFSLKSHTCYTSLSWFQIYYNGVLGYICIFKWYSV